MLMTSILSDEDVYLFNEGTHVRLYEKMARIRAMPRPLPIRASRSGRRTPNRSR